MGISSAELLIIVMISLPTMLALVKRHPHRARCFRPATRP
jgi:hypothetical protein